jgi:hypothetical protein
VSAYPWMAHWATDQPVAQYLDRLRELGPRCAGDGKDEYLDAILAHAAANPALSDKHQARIATLAAAKRTNLGQVDGGLPAIKGVRRRRP